MPGAYAGMGAADDVVDGGSAVELRFGGFKKSATKTVVVAL
ncbi:hypothetical protein [Mycolicibacterium porcinum]|uniref:Uncharacterized protein n=1 Tax=Mycolicibacterium porcinum TaxID=39693 RepID=A0ABV3VMM5_9MYCO|nr:hypothetical protein [Mycolicibacterium porcinum]